MLDRIHLLASDCSLMADGNLFLMGALPLHRLYHSAVGGGLLADLLKKAFALNGNMKGFSKVVDIKLQFAG